MWTTDKNFPARGFSTPPPHTGKSRRWSPGTPVRPLSEKKVWNSTRAKADLFHVIHKVPSGDSPYVRAKHVQLIEKDPSKAISLFWAAINSGDRVDSALKDMAVAMKQLNRSDEAIEAIKSFRHLCPLESQESLDNVLVELYKRSGRIEEQIEMLQHKVKTIEEGMAFGGKRTKAARSQGKKIQITIDQEYSRLLGNLAWAYLQQNNFKSAEELYRKALSLESDKNKQCNLAICLMHLNRTTEAKILLQSIRPSLIDGQLDESYARSFERATQMLTEIESREAPLLKKGSYSENCSNISFADTLKKGSHNENPYERTAEFGSKRTGGIEIGSSYKKTYGSPFLPARGIPKVPFTQPRRAFWGDQRRDFLGDDAVGGFNRKLSFEQPIMRHGNFEMSNATSQKSESGSPCFSGDWKKRSWRDLDEVNRESSLQHIEDDVKLTEELQSQCNSVAGNLEHSQDFSICKSTKTWADMVEEDEQELLSGINHCQEWNSGEEGFNDENMNSSNIIYHQTLTPFDQIEKLSENIESFDLKDGYLTQPETADSSSSMNQTVRRSLCFDQQQKTDRTDNYCSSTWPKKVLNFEGHGSFLENEREFTSGNGIKLLRRNRLKVFRDITLSSESPRL
ncbi:protein POLLENLESS 3-like [Camellia sinensis]|uniref:protein POLLENLESS 3-like n=1 Tax=Camellia sinensis TaxID=4442 RepID=UPI001036C54B|nr:protein POLLENLESS 3-like [Camellia sinensis]